MKSLFQRNWYTGVRRGGNGLLQAETNYVDTYREGSARLLVDEKSFIISQAVWEEQRAKFPASSSCREVSVLNGQEAYFNSAQALKQAAEVLKDSLAVSLFSETVKGIIQAETFLLKERGYASEEEYNAFWKKFYSGSCRYYSNQDRTSRSWYEHVGESTRAGNLFVRFKTQSLFVLGADQYLLTGNLSDSFHEVSLSFELDGFCVKEADGVLLRCPDNVCREATGLLENLKGVNLKALPKKEVAGLLGRGQGCVHVIDLVSDCVQALELYTAGKEGCP